MREAARALLGLVAASFCLTACAGPDAAPPGEGPDAQEQSKPAFASPPSLGEIFLKPSIAGIAPRVDSLSADGQWLLLRWDPVVAGSGSTERPSLRLLEIMRPEASEHRGVLLESVLPPVPTTDAQGEDEEKDEKDPFAEWSHSGHLLAIARDREIFLFDPAVARCELIFRDVAPALDTDGEEDGVEEEKGLHLTSEIRSLAFSPDGDELRFMDADNLFGISLPGGGFPGRTQSLEDTHNHSAHLDAAAHRLQWSVDLGTVFGRETRPIEPESGPSEEAAPALGDETTTENTSDSEVEETELSPQVWIESEERGVVLEGMDDLSQLRSDRLSPDGRWVVAREVDDSQEPEANLVPRWLEERVSTRTTRGRLADDLAARTALWAWTATAGSRTSIKPLQKDWTAEDPAEESEEDTPSDDAESEDQPQAPRPWVRMLGWAPQPEVSSPARYAFSIVSEDHREQELWIFTEGHAQRVWSERDPRWIGGPTGRVRWAPDGRHLFLGSEASEQSTTPGRNQLFRIDVDSGRAQQITRVEGEVDDFRVLESGQVLVVASRQDPAQRSIAVIDPAGEITAEFPPMRWLPTPTGWNVSARAGFDASLVVFEHQSLLQPAELWATDGTRSWPLTKTLPDSFGEREWIRPVTVSATAPDGARIFAHVYLPPGTSLADPGPKPRPTIVFAHGAGYLQNVTDSMTNYPLNAMFHSRLAQLGVPVIDVDYRGSAGYGQSFRTDVQYHLGGKDLDDIHGIVDLLAQRGLVDPERVGIYGGSYGGFLTLMALFTAPERWSAGAALRSVTDWRSYNPNYTQPRLGRPSTHPEAYARSSPIDLVDGLEDPLYLFHGMVDSNVFAQDTIRLMEELIDRGLDFDAMLYPSQSHAFADGEHWLDEYRRIERHLFEALGITEQN